MFQEMRNIFGYYKNKTLPWKAFCLLVLLVFFGKIFSYVKVQQPQRLLLDTDIDADDIFALLYLLKQNTSEIKLEAITISTNSWSDAGHGLNHVYDILYMMGRDDIPVGIGGEGGILPNGTILPNVGGYLPMIDQGMSTTGGCRYRQAISSRLHINTNYGLRKGFLPQGTRKYSPLQQPTTQQVMIDTISKGPISIFILGSHTNFAIFLMSNPHLKKNIKHIYVMGGGVRSKNPTGCCPKNVSSSCKPKECGNRGNLALGSSSNPYAEFNIFADPFAAYQVFHSGIPITLIPLDATNTIPINEKFFMEFERRQHTYEAQYSFMTLKIIRDTWFDDQFYTSYFMWDPFAAGVVASIMCNLHKDNGENDFAKMEYMNISIVTSNKPYGISDGSNPFFDGLSIPKFNLKRNGVHSGHVQIGLQDPFCLVKNAKGRCEDGYTKEVTGQEAVQVLVATMAKPNKDTKSILDKQFYKRFLEVLNLPQHSGKFNFTTQFPYYEEVLYKPNLGRRKLGKPVIFDMDMSPGDFLSLIYLLKVPIEIINLKAIFVNSIGWANTATIDVIYDVLHMMGRDDIPVGLGNVFSVDHPISNTIDCNYVKAIPNGVGGFLDSDTLYGLARELPRSPRRYTAENSLKFGARRDTDHPEYRQPSVIEVWKSTLESTDQGQKITILTNGPLTNLANIIISEKNLSSMIQDVYIVGGHISSGDNDEGNVFTIPSNKYAEFNMFLDPSAAKIVFESDLNITLIPLGVQRQVSSFPEILETLQVVRRTPEVVFAHRLLSKLYSLQQINHRYHHMDIYLGELLGASIMADYNRYLNSTFQVKAIKVFAKDDESIDGQMEIDELKQRSSVKILESVDSMAYYKDFANLLGLKNQSAVIGSFDEQRRMWSSPPNLTRTCHG
ncbi:uncharacterized protein LOC122057921 [Macadamia integrifolia]|uniref:uncharacterized protein LOC122057921 n=1 Tax=Macadamia integrifolia TaxID=60698 RepID=UPI001C52B414|nr:uncharacterized protein LOC122057921 [Macadamia integrifolia]